MSLLNKFREQAQDAKNTGLMHDMNETTAGGSARTLPAGKALAVLTGYIESGLAAREYNGKPKPPAREMRLIFTIVGGKGLNTDGQPEDYVLEAGQYPSIGTFWTSVTTTDKSKAVKWFNRMRTNSFGTGAETSFADFLGRAFMLPITHSEGKKDGKDVIYVNIDPATVDKPVNPITLEALEVPEVPEEHYKLLLWDAPSKEQWDSLYIETPEDAEKSRNYLQEHLMQSLDFDTSPLAALLGVGTAGTATKVAGKVAGQVAGQTKVEKKSAIPEPD